MDKLDEIKELLKKLDKDRDRVCDRLEPGRERAYDLAHLQADFMIALRDVINR